MVSVPGEVTQGARLLVNQTVSVATLRLDQPAELAEARASLGATALGLLLEGGNMVPSALPCLRHLGMTPEADVRLLWLPVGPHRGVTTSLTQQLSHAGVPNAAKQQPRGIALMVHDEDCQTALKTILGGPAASAFGAIGASSAMPPERSVQALTQAKHASGVAERTGSAARLFDDLALEGIIADDAIHERVQALTEQLVTSLLETSRTASEDLRTIHAFLDSNGAWDPAARELGIHRHTLRSRVARIERNTGLKMDRAQDRALLLIALLSHDQ